MKNKIYVLYLSFYGKIMMDIGTSTEIIGAYTDIEKARKKREQLIKDETDYFVDEAMKDNYYNKDMIIMFYGSEEENWNDYYELSIMEMELK